MKALPFTLAFLALTITSASAWAKSRCRSAEDLRKQVVYCDQNFDYYEAALACKNDYLKFVDAQMKPIRKKIEDLGAQSTGAAQNDKMEHSARVLASSIAELGVLAEYGKKVHREIEDYVYDLILPAFDEEEAKADIEDPKVLEKFMSRECYGDPRSQMENMEKEIRPVVADLDNTIRKARSLCATLGISESKLESLQKELKLNEAPGAGVPGGKGKGKAFRPSDISGTEEEKR